MDKGPLEDGAEKEDTRMKRGLALFLAALLTALTLTACGGSAGGNSSASSADHWEEDNWKAEAEEYGLSWGEIGEIAGGEALDRFLGRQGACLLIAQVSPDCTTSD